MVEGRLKLMKDDQSWSKLVKKDGQSWSELIRTKKKKSVEVDERWLKLVEVGRKVGQSRISPLTNSWFETVKSVKVGPTFFNFFQLSSTADQLFRKLVKDGWKSCSKLVEKTDPSQFEATLSNLGQLQAVADRVSPTLTNFDHIAQADSDQLPTNFFQPFLEVGQR